MELQEGKYYTITYRGHRLMFLYNGKDMGGNYCFVSEKAFYRVAARWITSINPEPYTQP